MDNRRKGETFLGPEGNLDRLKGSGLVFTKLKHMILKSHRGSTAAYCGVYD